MAELDVRGQVRLHPGGQPVGPLLVAGGERGPGPQHEVGDAREVLLCFSVFLRGLQHQRVFNIASATGTNGAARQDVPPFGLPPEAAVRFAGRAARLVDVEVELDAGLLGQGDGAAVAGVCVSDDAPAQQWEVVPATAGQRRELVPVQR